MDSPGLESQVSRKARGAVKSGRERANEGGRLQEQCGSSSPDLVFNQLQDMQKEPSANIQGESSGKLPEVCARGRTRPWDK